MPCSCNRLGKNSGKVLVGFRCPASGPCTGSATKAEFEYRLYYYRHFALTFTRVTYPLKRIDCKADKMAFPGGGAFDFAALQQALNVRSF